MRKSRLRLWFLCIHLSCISVAETSRRSDTTRGAVNFEILYKFHAVFQIRFLNIVSEINNWHCELYATYHLTYAYIYNWIINLIRYKCELAG